ncbi:MAG: DUF1512 family protein [Promethearchaeota archaeon]
MMNQIEGNEALSLVFEIMFMIMMFVSIFYGSKIRSWKASRAIKDGLEKLNQWNVETKQLTVSRFKEYCDENQSQKEIAKKIEEFLSFVTITPVELDTTGIIPKIEHILNNREAKYTNEVRALAITADPGQVQTLGKLLQVAAAVHMIHRLLLHYFIMGKKLKSAAFLQQVEMQLPLLVRMAKTYVAASKTFAEGSPIGDALGPLVVATLMREISQENTSSYEEIVEETILQEATFEGRMLYFIRAKGPGSTVGKPGTAIQMVLERHPEKIVRIITVDAGIKMEGDQTGAIVTGVGAAIGGFGVEKSKIEDVATKNRIPMDALICRQSLEDAIVTMNKPILDSVPLIIEKAKTLIRRNTEKNQSVIIAGIGNTIGVGV